MGAHYFLGNQLLGVSPSMSKWEDSRVNHNNLAMFCPQCGDVWARIADERCAGWFAATRLCSRHGDGSFIAVWRNLFEELPPEVLQYELHIRLIQFKEFDHDFK